MSKRRPSRYAEVTFLDSHLNLHKLYDFISDVMGSGGYLSSQKNSSESVIGLDIPLEGKNRTKRLYVHISDDGVKLRYHPMKERKFEPYRAAIKRLEGMVEDGRVKRIRAEETNYDDSIPPLVLDLL